MVSLPQVAAALESLFTDDAATAARTSGWCQRQRQLSGPAFAQTLVFGWWENPSASLSQLCQLAAVRNVTITPQGLDQRFTPAAATFLETLLTAAVGRVITADPVAAPVLERFTAVTLLDSTTITLPDALGDVWQGCGGRVATNTQAALKCTVQLDLLSGRVTGPDLSAGRTQDRATALQHAPVPKGALRIADLGFWSLDVLAGIARSGGYFLSRAHSQTTVLVDDRPVHLASWLTAQNAPIIDVPVTLGLKKRLPARLLAIRVPQAVADQRRRRLKESARAGGHGVPRQTLALAGWTLLVTNVPAELLSVAEAEVLRRARWQIELLFKLWKSSGQVATSRSAQPWRILCEVYAKLLAMVLQHWLFLTAGCLVGRRNLTQAAATVRAEVRTLLRGLASGRRLRAGLRALQPLLAAVRAPATRPHQPSLLQLLADPDRVFRLN